MAARACPRSGPTSPGSRHDVHAPDLAVVGGIHDLDHREAGLLVERHAPQLLEALVGIRVVDPLVVGNTIGMSPSRGALHVVLPAQRMQPVPGGRSARSSG